MKYIVKVPLTVRQAGGKTFMPGETLEVPDDVDFSVLVESGKLAAIPSKRKVESHATDN